MNISLLELVKKLRLPEQDQASLSFCSSTHANKVAAWASQLPATRTNHTSVLLYQALPEICRLQTAATNRLEILEQVRPYVQHCIEGLTKSFLGQPLIMPDSAMKTAVIAQALQKHLSNGYSLVARELTLRHVDGKLKKDDKVELLGLAIHRAISGMGLQLLRNLQIYTPVSNQFWQELYTLYQLAEQLELLRQPYLDPLLSRQPATTIAQVFKRALLLSCIHANQLRQQEVEQIYTALENWSQLVQLRPLTPAASQDSSDSSSDLYVVDINGNLAPHYKSQLRRTAPAAADASVNQLCELQLTPLLETLRRIRDQGASEHDPITVPTAINERLLTHVLGAWGEEFQRYQPRKTAHNTLEIAVGLTSVHYHLAGQQSFERFLRDACQLHSRTSTQFRLPGLGLDYDPWDDAFDADKESRPSFDHTLKTETSAPAATKEDKFPLFLIQISDVSPGGYGLTWRDATPAQVKAGELVALREPGDPHWGLGIIRWVKQHKSMSQLGIQLVAQHAQAIAIQQLQKTGQDNVYMRGLISSKAGAQFAETAVITAQYPFRVHNKVRLNHQGTTSMAQLNALLCSSSSINVFGFQMAEASQRALREGSPLVEDFQSRW